MLKAVDCEELKAALVEVALPADTNEEAATAAHFPEMDLAGVAQVMRFHRRTQELRKVKIIKESAVSAFGISSYYPRKKQARNDCWNWCATAGALKTASTTAGTAPRTRTAAQSETQWPPAT